MSSVRRISSLLALVILASLIYPISTSAAAALSPEAFEECLLDKINADRQANGAPALAMAYDINPEVRSFSQKMGGEGDLRHMTTTERNPILPAGTFTWGENVAWHSNPSLPDCSTIHNMFMDSSGHRANILSSNKRFVALGTYIGSNGTWVTELFFDSSSYEAPGASGDGTFWDDDGNLFEADIEKLATAGITAGCNPPTNNRYCPDSPLTRGQMAAFLVRALDLSSTGGTDFTDDDGAVFEADIEKLSAAGITRGCNPPANDRFCPYDRVSRAEMAAFLVRALGL